jgi:hemerythrin-like domain-containing protein
MTTFTSFMGGDHHQCDQYFAAAEAAVDSGDWQQATAAHQQFIGAMQQHFAMEEELLFPAFEQASGHSDGPTMVMRHEHEQMRALFADMDAAVASKEPHAYLGASETLLILMQQHNAKEEQILYPMSERLLAEQQEALLTRMQALEA